MKSLFFGFILLSLVGFSPVSKSQITTNKEPFSLPSVISANQEPPAKNRYVEHKIKLSMTAKTSISAIIIEVPRGLEVGNEVRIHDHSGKTIPTENQVTGNSITITFPSGFQKEEIIEIDLEDVTIKGIANAWLYRVSVKGVGNNRLIPIGVASVRIYN
jgi:hypothetical protein